MRLFSRPREITPPPEPGWARSTPRHCAGCKRRALRYVYMENDKDYCVPCARDVMWQFAIRPAGRRKEDITDLDTPESDLDDPELPGREENVMQWRRAS